MLSVVRNEPEVIKDCRLLMYYMYLSILSNESFRNIDGTIKCKIFDMRIGSVLNIEGKEEQKDLLSNDTTVAVLENNRMIHSVLDSS